MTTKNQYNISPPLSPPLALWCALSELLTRYEQGRKQKITLPYVIKHVIKPTIILRVTQDIYHSYLLHRTANHTSKKETPQIIDSLDGLTVCIDQLLIAKDLVERSPLVEHILGLDHTQDLFLYKLITRLSHKAYLLKIYDLYKQVCRDEVRDLTHDERAFLNLSLWLTHLATGEELQLVDPQPNDLWHPKSMDPLSPSRLKLVQRSLMPSLQSKAYVERRGLVILQTLQPTSSSH